MQRQQMKLLLADLEKQHSILFPNLLNAMRPLMGDRQGTRPGDGADNTLLPSP